MQKYALYFPQWHSISANDSAWGKGFTDWSLVAVANALNGWVDRRAPARGFYDLSREDTVRNQFQEASALGLDGFGIYHYWFKDGPELVAVENYVRKTHLPNNFKFFLIWANESWTKRWSGRENIVIKEAYTAPNQTEIREHVSHLLPFLTHASCARWKGRPMFVFYRPEFLHDAARVVSLYRSEFERAGVNPSLGFFCKSEADLCYSEYFDFCYFFEPRLFFNCQGPGGKAGFSAFYRWLLHHVKYSKVESLAELYRKFLAGKSRAFSFSQFLNYLTSERRHDLLNKTACPVQNIVTAGWNNAPRYRERFTQLATPTVSDFKLMMEHAGANNKIHHDLPLLCNAWNEWSEGAALEPCAYLGDSLIKCYVNS